VTLVAVFADADTGLDVRVWGPPAPTAGEAADEIEGEEDGEEVRIADAPQAPRPPFR